jgi:hypothetical protein
MGEVFAAAKPPQIPFSPAVRRHSERSEESPFYNHRTWVAA